MKKVLLIESHELRGGHHFAYLNSLLHIKEIEYVIISPSLEENLGARCIQINCSKGLVGYLKWLRGICSVVQQERPDIVHFLYGDIFYRYFGIGLKKIKASKIFITFHHVKQSRIRKLSYERIMYKIDCGIVHTDNIKNYLNSCNIKNIIKIDYPKFVNNKKMYSQKEAREYFGLPVEKKVMLALGKTRWDKGLDILLESLEGVSENCVLFIAGGAEDFDEQYILEKKEKLDVEVHTRLEILTDDEVDLAVESADIVVLPYRKIFEGASGPLVEGVWRKKMIIGPNHGSLGNLIEKWHLGYTFETENITDLRNRVKKAVKEKFVLDNKYLEYRESICEADFRHQYDQLYRKLNV